MRAGRLLLSLLALALVAGCTRGDESSDGDAPAESDPGLLGVSYVDVTAPVANDCMGADARGVPPAEFDVPGGAAWARVEGSFPTGRVGLDVARDDGRRVGYAAGGPPVVVVVEAPSLDGATKLAVKAFTCEGGSDQRVRVFATFRRAAP